MTYNSSLTTANQLLKAGKLEDARREYQKLIELKPNCPWNYYYLGQVFFQEEKWSDATLQYRQAIKLNPNSANLHNSLAEVLIKQGELDEAINSSQKAISLEPDAAIYHQTLALVYEAKSNFGQALITWQKVLSLNPNDLRATQKISWLQTDIAKDCVESGEKLNKAGKIREAVEFYQQALMLNPQQPMPIYRTCGNNLITLGRFEKAESVFEQLIKAYPELPDGYDGYARLTHSLPDWELALKRWSEAIIKFPQNISFQVQKGNVLINLSRLDEAEAVFQQLKEKYPNKPQGYERYAALTHKIPNWELALERWSEAVALFPNNINFQVHKGNALIKLSQKVAKELIAMGRFAEAEEKFREALQIDPNNLTVLLQAGILASQQGNRELALERFERAIDFYHPQKAIDAYILAATELKYLGRDLEAEGKYEQILSFHQQRGLYPEVKLLGTRLTSIQELGLLLDRLVRKQPDTVDDIVYLAKLTDRILFFWNSRYLTAVDKDAPSLLPKLKILRELFWQFLATPNDFEEWDLGVANFGYDLYLLVVAKLLNDKFLKLFSLYFHALVQQWDEYLLVLQHFNMAIQLLEQESQRLNSSEWGRFKLVHREILQPLPLMDKFCFEGLLSSASYVMGTDERVPKSQIEATVKYLPGLMDEEKKYLTANILRLAKSLKLRSRQTIDIFKDFICEPPYTFSEGYFLPRSYYNSTISQEFIDELEGDNPDDYGKKISYVALNTINRKVGRVRNIYLDPRGFLEEIAVSQKKLDSYCEDDVVFGIPNLWRIWGGYQNYAHLLFDQISSLILYQKLNLSCKIFVPHITDKHWEIFSHLNIPKEKILVKQDQKFKYFIIGRYLQDVEMVNFYRNLRELIVAKRGDIPSEYRARYVYFSRRYSERRKIINEAEIEELMASFGFLIVYAEKLSFEEQALLMDHASFVVGPHGAGFTNGIMIRQGSHIMEIADKLHGSHRFFHKIWVLGKHNFYQLYCDQTTRGLEMNIDKLKRAVCTILENS